MVIDIIDPNDEQFKDLDSLQYAMIRAAQAQKNEILAKTAEAKGTLFRGMLSRNAVRSTAYLDACARMDAAAEAQIDVVRDDLLHQLAYSSLFSGGNEMGPYSYPENPNYNLTFSQRFLIVRDYYMHVTTDPKARLDAYAMDTLARVYLGEYYQTLYELLASYIKN